MFGHVSDAAFPQWPQSRQWYPGKPSQSVQPWRLACAAMRLVAGAVASLELLHLQEVPGSQCGGTVRTCGFREQAGWHCPVGDRSPGWVGVARTHPVPATAEHWATADGHCRPVPVGWQVGIRTPGLEECPT
jgi:hypothetical protein